jgi:L,D-peptidoglycan transpeptidase YkuD (ErfK/YbiS/YcfS/YnhG family)
MSALLRILLLVLLVGLGFVVERHFSSDGAGFFQSKSHAPVPRIATGEGSRAVYEISRKQMEMQLAAAKPADQLRAGKTEAGLLSGSLQLVLVTAPGWGDSAGQVQRYRRALATLAWEKVGSSSPCVLGKAGLAAAGNFAGRPGTWPEKKDGDGKTPAGIFAPAQAFGFKSEGQARGMGLKLPYAEVGESLICVSDPKSPQFGKLAASGGSRTPRGVNLTKAGEANKWGLLLGAYNQGQTPGPCLLLHMWDEPGKPTGGDIGCHEARMLELLAWLDPSANPAVAIVPAGELDTVRAAWGLP